MSVRQYIVTERAHMMCPNMQFGIKLKINRSYDISAFQKALQALKEAHPFLQSIIAREEQTRRLCYYSQEIEIPFIVEESVEQWKEDYTALLQKGWDIRKESLLKVIVYPGKQDFEVMFIAHHLLGDGRAILGLACEFADAYVTGKKPSYVEERLIHSMEDLPKGSDLPWISRQIIQMQNRKWKKEKHNVSYEEYHKFETAFIQKHPVTYSAEIFAADKVEELHKRCKEEAVSINDYLVAEMMCKEGINKVVIAADIRRQLPCYQQGALGNYATAMGIQSKAKSNTIFERAKDVKRQIQSYMNDNQKSMLVLACYLRMNPELIDAVAISTLGDFKSKAGRFVGSAMFGYENRDGYSITNLGNINSETIVEAMFIPPASPANKKTVGVLSVNGRMTKCTAEYIQG